MRCFFIFFLLLIFIFYFFFKYDLSKDHTSSKIVQILSTSIHFVRSTIHASISLHTLGNKSFEGKGPMVQHA